MITLAPDHPLILACKELFPDRLHFSRPAELRVTETGFAIKAALRANMHFGIVRANLGTRRLTLSDYDAYDGNEQFIATAELSAQQVEELKAFLASATH